MRAHLDAGDQAAVAEIADYELRRELLRAGKETGVGRLDSLGHTLGYAPLTTMDMRRAAQLWAEVRTAGRPTAPDLDLDGDVILAAQAVGLAELHDDVVVATTNTRHLSRFVPAREWTDI